MTSKNKSSKKRTAELSRPSLKKSKPSKEGIAEALAKVMDRYVDLDPDEENRKKKPGGRPPSPLIPFVAVPCYRFDDPTQTKIHRCWGAPTGCTHVWSGKLDLARILKHAATCRHIPLEIRNKCNSELSKASLGAQVSSGAISISPTPPPSYTPKECNDTPAVTEVSSRIHPSMPVNTGIMEPPANSLFAMSKKAHRENLKKAVDYAVMQFVCVGGMPPTSVDRPQWKNIFVAASPGYEPASSSTISNVHIPREAAYIHTEQLKHLQTCENLTITFDGGTTRRQQSVYTVHIVTADRRVFLWEGNEASEESHTSEHIFNVLCPVCPQCTVTHWHFCDELIIFLDHRTDWSNAVPCNKL
jgi:hypothetical protein